MEIVWSAQARNTFFKIMDYLQANWTKKEMRQFSNKTEIILKAISQNPRMFASSGKQPTVRRAIIDKNNSLFYRIDENEQNIQLLTFFDNRQNPQKIPLR